jgi:MFS transporter, OFA family, oxalate/formate antiporter
MLGLLTTRYFGLERLAQIYGYLFAVFAAGTALGPYVMGVGFDVFHTYNPMLVVFGVALSLAGLLISRLGSYDYPARVANAVAAPFQTSDPA